VLAQVVIAVGLAVGLSVGSFIYGVLVGRQERDGELADLRLTNAALERQVVKLSRVAERLAKGETDAKARPCN